MRHNIGHSSLHGNSSGVLREVFQDQWGHDKERCTQSEAAICVPGRKPTEANFERRKLVQKI